MAPFLLPEILGKYGAYLVYLLIGFAFGYVLEIAGFGNSRKLAAQFYFNEMTVLKVMFTGIIVAMVLIFSATGLGLLDYNLLWVNPTYLWPGIVGGLIMGVGFIIGGFCPGTSLVAFATAKVDGIFFVGGVLFGIFLFGETVPNFTEFWNSSYMGRVTLMDWLGLSTGWVVLLVVLMALFMFWGAEQLEKMFGGEDPKFAPRIRVGGAGAVALVAVGVIAIGQPSTMDRWNWIAPEKAPLVAERGIYMHPAEVMDIKYNEKLSLIMIDVRDETDYNLFHVEQARHIPANEIMDYVPEFNLAPANTVFVVMGNDETLATDVWKTMVAESVPNVYVVEGGINNWLDVYGDHNEGMVPLLNAPDDTLRYQFDVALGARQPASDPHLHEYDLEYVPKLKMELKQGPSGGGCG